jgi:hypothetical protein
MTTGFPIAFNVATAIIFIGLLDGMARVLKKLLPNRTLAADPSRPRYLDESALETPSLTLADAARESTPLSSNNPSMSKIAAWSGFGIIGRVSQTCSNLQRRRSRNNAECRERETSPLWVKKATYYR